MDKCADDGVQNCGYCKDYCNEIQRHRECEIYFYGGHHSLGKGDEVLKSLYEATAYELQLS